MEIRRVQESDQSGWLSLRSMLWPKIGQMVHLSEMRQMMTRPDQWAVFVCVSSNDRLTGFVEVSLHEDAASVARSSIGYLEAWYVDPEFRMLGRGRALVEAAEKWAQEKGCTVIGSDADLENTGSREAHTALGYTEINREVLFHKTISGSET